MMGTALIRPIRSVFWELRTAWATGRRVSLSLDPRCDRHRIEGHVKRVSATDAFVYVGNEHIPGELILAVHNPSRLGDSTVGDRERWHGRALRWQPQVEELPGIEA